MNEEIEILYTKGKEPGPHIVVLGGIHGNEPAPTIAIRELHKTLELTRGEVTFVPLANVEAAAKGKRFLEEDLNRVFHKTGKPGSYEARRANAVAPFIDRADFLFDIHTFAEPGHTCVFVDYPTAQNQALANVLGAEYALLDWPKMYEESTLESYDTTRYAAEAGRDGLLIECGQHADLESVPRAKEFMMRMFAFFKMVPEDSVRVKITKTPIAVSMTKVFTKDEAGDAFMRKWKHLEAVPQGTVIATRAGGEQIVAEVPSLIMFPKHGAPVGGEWFYIGHIV